MERTILTGEGEKMEKVVTRQVETKVMLGKRRVFFLEPYDGPLAWREMALREGRKVQSYPTPAAGRKILR